MLTDLFNKIKAFLVGNQRDLYLAALVFLMSVVSFGLGRLSAVWPEKEPITVTNSEELGTNSQERITNNPSPQSAASLANSSMPFVAQGNFVASRNGSSYHLPDCPGAKQIKEENKIWFQSEADAKAAGYKPAGNCPDL